MDLRLADQVSQAEYLTKRQNLVAEQLDLRRNLEVSSREPDRRFEQTKNAFSFGKRAQMAFLDGTPAEKRAILHCVGSNYRLQDKTVLMSAKKPFDLILERGVIPGWSALVDAVRTFFIENPDAVTWPGFLFPPEEKPRK